MLSYRESGYIEEDRGLMLYSITFSFLVAAVCVVVLRQTPPRPFWERGLTLLQAILSVVPSSYPADNSFRNPYHCVALSRHRVVHFDPFPDSHRNGKAYRILTGSSGNARNKHESGSRTEHMLSIIDWVSCSRYWSDPL